MWLVLKTNTFKEQQAKDFILSRYSIVNDVYLPLCRVSHNEEDNTTRNRFRPVIYGMLFVNISITEDQLSSSLPLLHEMFSYNGSLKYKEEVFNRQLCITEEKTLYSNIRLLSYSTTDMSLIDRLHQATVPDEDMQRFIFYNEQIANTIEGVTILDKRYLDLIREKDIVRIVTGPMAGWCGVVQQVKTKGRKDRNLIIRFGNSLCLSIPNIRRYDIIVEHEAPQGQQAKTIGAWRAIDTIIGHFQNIGHTDDAPAKTRTLVRDYTLTHDDSLLATLDTPARISVASLSEYLNSDKKSLNTVLRELIPDNPCRPFLTPTSGVDIPVGQDSACVAHDGFTELVTRINLKSHFRTDGYVKDKYNPVDYEDYEYFAHVALFTRQVTDADGNSHEQYKVVAAWNGFYDHYALLDTIARNKFLLSLKEKDYTLMYKLLTDSDYKFEKVGNIGGFTTTIARTNNPAKCLDSFINTIASAAVELWQGTRLLMWRQLLQRHVLLHKVPVSDTQTVITPDKNIDKCFITPTDEASMSLIATKLNTYAAEIERLIANGSVYSAVTIFLQIIHATSVHFVKDDHYNFVTSGNPIDDLCTQMFNTLLPHLDDHTRRYTQKGMQELQANDAWRYFKQPTCLNHTKELVK